MNSRFPEEEAEMRKKHVWASYRHEHLMGGALAGQAGQRHPAACSGQNIAIHLPQHMPPQALVKLREDK